MYYQVPTPQWGSYYHSGHPGGQSVQQLEFNRPNPRTVLTLPVVHDIIEYYDTFS